MNGNRGVLCLTLLSCKVWRSWDGGKVSSLHIEKFQSVNKNFGSTSPARGGLKNLQKHNGTMADNHIHNQLNNFISIQ